jgi:hypothetical protein
MQHRMRDAVAFLEPALRIHGHALCYLVPQRILALMLQGIGLQLVPNRLEYTPLLGWSLGLVPVGMMSTPSRIGRGTFINAPRRHDSLLVSRGRRLLLRSASRPAPQ